MKFAIIADIHANLEAFTVVLEDIKQQKCTHYACLGDVVGYNANPKECLDLVRKLNIPVVKGNHDEYCSTDPPPPRRSIGPANNSARTTANGCAT